MAEITELKRIIDENEVVRGWFAVVEFDEVPEFRLGKCEVRQNGKS